MDDDFASPARHLHAVPAGPPPSPLAQLAHRVLIAARDTLLALLAVFLCSPPGVVLARTWALLAPGHAHSRANEMHFRLAHARSPLQAAGLYPIALTAGVVPKRFHSHNDYVQEIPLLKALSYGAGSIEADIWLVDGELYVGHDAHDITSDRTLASLYLDPLLALLDAANAGNSSSSGGGDGPLRGVWETAPHLPLHLLIDIKTDGPSTFAALHAALAPLRQRGFLTSWTASPDGSIPKPGATPPLLSGPGPSPHAPGTLARSVLTVIGTGHTPAACVLALGHAGSLGPRDVFLDAPLTTFLNKDGSDAPAARVYSPALSPLASADFRAVVGPTWVIPGSGRAKVRRLVRAAHARGIQTRFWRTPNAPVVLRSAIWQLLLDEGSDWINVDDLPAARHF